MLFPALLGRIHALTTTKQLQQVMGQTDKVPLLLTTFQASETEPAEVTGLFDLTEHRFNDVFPERIGASAFHGSKFPGHSVLYSCVLWNTASRLEWHFAMFLFPRGHVGVNTSIGKKIAVCFAEVTGIGADDLRQVAIGIGFDFLYKGHNLLFVVGFLSDPGGNNDLSLFINSSLAVIALDETLGTAGRHDT